MGWGVQYIVQIKVIQRVRENCISVQICQLLVLKVTFISLHS
jgi:hypothetical protein